MYKNIYNQIKKYKTIVLARHIGPDPDCLASQIALREIIKHKFPNKNVYAVGITAAKFYHFGRLDKIREEDLNDALLIVLDTPDASRVDGINLSRYKYSIKIDHHPFMEKFCNLEFIDAKASSVCQMIVDLCFKTPLSLTKETAEILFMGIISDTNRFLYYYTSAHTFEVVSKLINRLGINIEELYLRLYSRPLNEVRLQGFIAMNMTVTENKFGYIKVPNEKITEFQVDSASAGNMINEFNHIKEVVTWATFSQDSKNEVIRGAMRSRGPIINDLAAKYGGGGHKFACGARLETWDQVDNLIKDLDDLCKKYLEDNK